VRLEPLTKYQAKPVAILNPGQRALEAQTGHGVQVAYGRREVEKLLDSLSGHVLYVHDSLERMVHTTGALSWSISMWRGRATRAQHIPSGCSVTSLRGTLDAENAYEDLERVLKWLRSYGVGPASIPSMAWSLMRASLPRVYQCGFDPEIGREAMYGGRQEITEAGIYQNMVALDIESAYPSAMARPEGYALSLRSVDPSTELDPHAAGIARARVMVPESMPYGPLPVRVMPEFIRFQHGLMEGVWPWCELEAAQRLGAEVEVLEAWAPERTADLFGPWWPMVQEGRALPGRSGVLAKAISNSTWGQFGMQAKDRATKRWSDDEGRMAYLVLEEDHQLPHSWTAHVAAETTSRVRTQLLLEGLYSGLNPCHIDTDGIIAPAGSVIPGDGQEGPGHWRIKAEIPEVDIRGPQLYRWTCPGCGVTHEHWHYNTSGIPEQDAPGYFTGERISGPEIELRRVFE
jgi:DNA polymerase type B, organellar and viral